ncbi:heavy-metal-associated domain-containing protein [Flectobacillus roseus]|jgi:copper chaperone CopZ
MTHTYQLTGMTCGSCEKSSLLSLENIASVEVSKDSNTSTISMDKHIASVIFKNH